MKAILYKVLIRDDTVHSYNQRVIKEVFLPNYEIAFNEEGYVFETLTKRPTYDNFEREIELNDDLSNLIFDFRYYQQIKDKTLKNFLKMFDILLRK